MLYLPEDLQRKGAYDDPVHVGGWLLHLVLAEFYGAWVTRFPPLEEGVKGAQPSKGALVLEFCGLTITQLETRPIRITCGKPVQDLKPGW